MATRGFLIRFIDIGLIVLFGFLMISDIEASSRVELAGAPDSTEAVAEPEVEPALLLVQIAADGSFLVGAPGTPAAERTALATLEELQAALVRRAALDADADRETLVLIEPHPASAVQRTVDVMDAADAAGIAKSLQMDIDVVPSGTGGGTDQDPGAVSDTSSAPDAGDVG